jgi:Tfp pilus assembly protein FimT
LAIALIAASIAVPSLRGTMAAYRGSAAIQGLASQLSLARMRASSSFTRSRVAIDTTTQTYRRDLLDKATTTYRADGTDLPLGSNVSFGFGGITTPAGGQSTIQQSTQIYFNSRGMPVDVAGAPIGTYAVYLNNDGRYYAVTINTVGQILTWRYNGSAWAPQ